MSKQINNKGKFLKPIKEENSIDFKNREDQKYQIDPYTKNSLEMIKQNFYPSSNKYPELTPFISKKNYRSNNSQKRPMSKILFKPNYQRYLEPQNLFGSDSKNKLLSEKTEVNLINKNLNQNMNKNKINNMNEIKNINIINKNINQKNSNKITDNKKKAPLIIKNTIIHKSNNNIINNTLKNDNISNLQNLLFRAKKSLLNNCSSLLISNAGMFIINPKLIYSKINIYNKNERHKNNIKWNNKIMFPSSIIDTYKNSNNKLSTIGMQIMNNKDKISLRGITPNKEMNNQKNFGNILRNNNNHLEKKINTNKKSSNLDIINLLRKENTNLNYQELEEIDNHSFYLRDLGFNSTILVRILQLIEVHMNIELLLYIIDNYNKFDMIDDELYLELINSLNTYFNTIYLIYNEYNSKNTNTIFQNNGQNKADYIDNFFLYQSLNYILHKTIKIQICFFTSIFFILKYLPNYNTLINNLCYQIIKDISNPLFSLFQNFMKEEINAKFPELITSNLEPDFYDQFNKVHKIQAYTKNLKKSEIIILILKQLDKCINMVKYYFSLGLKESILPNYYKALNQLLYSLKTKTLEQILKIIFNTLLYDLLFSIVCKIKLSNIKSDDSNVQMGSSIVNRVNDFPPFLPSIKQNYKYTLILTLNKTLIHLSLFNVEIWGYLVRPYCFEFLEELNDLYEIIIFSKESNNYFDYILNKIDKDNKIIKYRLYEEIDLKFIGRDFSKVIVIDTINQYFDFQTNTILINPWKYDINDLQLKDLLKILKDIVTLKVKDVRTIIRKINNEIKISKNKERPYENINVAKLIDENKSEI